MCDFASFTFVYFIVCLTMEKNKHELSINKINYIIMSVVLDES